MKDVIVSERERLDLIQQGDNMFLEVQGRLYDAQRQPAESKDKLVTVLDHFTVYGSLDAVTELYLNDDKKMVLDFSESRELVVLKPTTAQRPLDRTSLRWSLFHSPSRLLAKDQDFCYLEVMKPYGTATGRRGWARCAHSITHAACPEFRNAQGMDINRAELFYCGLFFEETDALGVLNVTVFYNVKRDNIPPVLMPMVLKARARRSVELVNHYLKMSDMILRSKKVSLTRALQLQGERRCGACANQLSMWRSKDKCVTCGSVRLACSCGVGEVAFSCCACCSSCAISATPSWRGTTAWTASLADKSCASRARTDVARRWCRRRGTATWAPAATAARPPRRTVSWRRTRTADCEMAAFRPPRTTTDTPRGSTKKASRRLCWSSRSRHCSRANRPSKRRPQPAVQSVRV
jgi:hypothetical protein